MTWWLYVIRFNTGTVKVGRTKSIQDRLQDHLTRFGAAGVQIEKWEAAPVLGCAPESERVMIDRCTIAGGVRTRREFFSGLDYDAAVAIMRECSALADPAPGQLTKLKAIQMLGGSAAVAARKLGISRQAVFGWPPVLTEKIAAKVRAAAEEYARARSALYE